MKRSSPRIAALLAAVACVSFPAAAPGQQASAGVGLSDSVAALGCTLYLLDGCPAANPGHLLFERYQALAVDRTGGANAFLYVRAGIPWDSAGTSAAAIGSACVDENHLPDYYGTPWMTLAENYALAARRAGLDPLIAITTNTAARYPGAGNAEDPANPSANQYFCGFRAIVSTLDAFATRHGVAPPTEYETYDEPDGAKVNNACNPTPAGNLPPHQAEQCAGWYYYEADLANRTQFGRRLILVALSADGDSANDPNLIAIKAYASYLTGTIGLYPAVWSFHPYEDLSATAYPDDGTLTHDDTATVSAFIAALYRSARAQPSIWLTEAAAQITDPVTRYFGRPEGCDDREADDPAPYGLGGCLDGNPKGQAYAAADFLDLPRSGSAFPGQITRVYWHQFGSLAAHPTTWDSGLVAPGDAGERASYCVLSGESVALAVTDPECDRTGAAEDAQDSARTYPEPDGGPDLPRPDFRACPQPWCGFNLLRLRLTQMGRQAGLGTIARA
ncbi:MAG: hypothetical protein JO243_03310 [Solirubrobacterales bacterium]|nr:hypothetical protein [Solirubrobacterales bacterium]